MLLEYNKFIDQSESNIIIEVLEDGPYLDFILERFDYYDRDKKVRISPEYRAKLITIESEIDSYLEYKINPFTGKSINKQNGKFKEIEYNIEPSEHFYIKFFRQDFESHRPGYVKPGLHEGIDLIYNNHNDITRLIVAQTISDGNHVLIRTKDNSLYSEIVIFNKINSDEWRLILKTQMKGLNYLDTKSYHFPINLHPNGQRLK